MGDQSLEFARKAQDSLPYSTQIALTTALPNIVNGACWGFISVEEAEAKKGALKGDKNILVKRIGNAYLLEVRPDYIVSAVEHVAPGIINAKDIQDMKQGMAEAASDFEKFLVNKGDKDEKTLLVGIYCINDTSSITYKSVLYPAFRVSMNTVLTLCNRWGYKLVVNGKAVSPQEASANMDALFASTILSPTSTGIFIKLVTPDDTATFAEKKKAFKAAIKSQRAYK